MLDSQRALASRQGSRNCSQLSLRQRVLPGGHPYKKPPRAANNDTLMSIAARGKPAR